MMLETASFSNFLRTVIYIVFFYYMFRFIARLLFPVLVKKAVAHAEERFRDQYRNQFNGHAQQQSRPDGEVTLDTTGAATPREKKKVGEYIDYEEL